MIFLPITVYQGQQMLFRQFCDGMVIMPLQNADRETVANALREILSLVEGDARLPTFSLELGSDYSPQSQSNPENHANDVFIPLSERPALRSHLRLHDQPQNDL